MRELVEQFSELRKKKEEVSKQAKEIQQKLDELEHQIIENMINDGTSTVIYNGIGRITLTTQSFPRIKDQDKFFSYLRTVGAGDIIKETVHSQTLRGYWNNLKATKGETPVPLEIGLEVFSEATVSLTR